MSPDAAPARPADGNPDSPGGSLTRQVATRIGIGALLIVLAVSAVGYWFTFSTFEEQELARLQDHVAEKGRTESRLFRTAEEEVAAFRDLFLEHYAGAPEGMAGEFDRFFRRGPDGAWRTDPALYEGTLTADGDYFEWVSGFIGNDQETVPPDLRRRLVIALRLLARLGPATDPALVLHASFPENAIVLYSEDPWGLTAAADLDMTGQSVIGATLPSANPDRRPVWTNLYYDLTAGAWAITYQLPVDHQGRHLINPSHDVRLSGLLERVLAGRMANTHNMILTAGGALIAHPDRLAEIQQHNGQISLEELGEPVLLDRYRQIRDAGPIREGSVSIVDDAAHDAYLGVTRLHGPNWWWVTVYPKEAAAANAHRAARLILVLGVAFFLLVMGVVYGLLRRLVAGPIGTLTTASRIIGHGDYGRVADALLPLPEEQPNEIGLLARTFRKMSRSLRDTRELDDAVFLVDEDGRIEEVNPAAARLTGHPVEELRGRGLLDLDVSTDPADLRNALGELDPEESERLSTRYRRSDGGTVPVEVVFRAFDTPAGTRYLATARDISERIAQEEERLRVERELLEIQRSESLGQLAGGVAHDFNNILASILGNAELALAELPRDTPQREMLQEISSAASRAAGLANQMLAYSGKGQFEVRDVSLSRICREAAEMARSSMPTHVDLRLELEDDLVPVAADATQIHQVATTLLLNAGEAIGEAEGRITARTYVRHYDDTELEGDRTGDKASGGEYVTLEVADDGPGFDDRVAERMFEPFFSTKFTGRGLGLAALLGIVRGHDGAVLASGKPGRGARFRILLPPAREAGRDEAKRASEETGVSRRRSGAVLVVDDERAVRGVAERMLRRLGFETLTAADGEEAIRTFDECAGDIGTVLLDLSMPGMDGVEVCREILDLDPDVRVVMTSGYSEAEVTAQLEDLPVAGFVQKPFSLDALERAMLQGPRSQPPDR